MTTDQLKQAVALAIPATSKADANTVASTFIALATMRVARQATFGKTYVTFNTITGKAVYDVGKDIATKVAKVAWLGDIYQIGVPGGRIQMVDLDRFNQITRSQIRTGTPEIATVYASQNVLQLEMWPTPNGAISCGCAVKQKIENVDDLPTNLIDVIYTHAISLLAASVNPILAVQMNKDGLMSIFTEGPVSWDGSQIEPTRTVGNIDSGFTRTGSGNLLG